MKSHYILIFMLILLICNCKKNATESNLPSSNIPLVINEIMAMNASTIQDEYGEYDDWIELYNAGIDTINIGGLFISDNANLFTKCRITDKEPALTTIFPDSFLILWCDGQPQQGALHASFKLSGLGEDVIITESDGVTIIDRHTFGSQTTDYSIGRSPDGNDLWVIYEAPTPGFSNP